MPHIPCALPATRTTILLATWIAFVPAFIGCAKKPMMIPFLQKEHREAYRFTEQDLERIKFYSSSDVVVEDVDETPGGEGRMLVDAAKPGVAIGSGPGWIRVSFRDSSAGLVFLADPAAHGDTGYSLATEVDGGGYRLVSSNDDRILRYGGRRYRVPIGAFAELVVDRDKFEEFLTTLQQNPGRPVQER